MMRQERDEEARKNILQIRREKGRWGVGFLVASDTRVAAQGL